LAWTGMVVSLQRRDCIIRRVMNRACSLMTYEMKGVQSQPPRIDG
jgi:hypothetical protein